MPVDVVHTMDLFRSQEPQGDLRNICNPLITPSSAGTQLRGTSVGSACCRIGLSGGAFSARVCVTALGVRENPRQLLVGNITTCQEGPFDGCRDLGCQSRAPLSL